MRVLTVSVVTLLLGAGAVPAADAPAASVPAGAFDPAQLDRSVEPCDDFYAFVCNEWKAQNPLPPDRSHYRQGTALAERNLEILRSILESAADTSRERSPLEAKVGDYYASCMNEERIADRGTEPIEPYLERIAAIDDRTSLIETVAYLHRHGVPGMFSFFPSPDMDNSDLTIAFFNQGGLGLPDRDFYFRDDEKSRETREKYIEHVANMLVLLGDDAETASATARTIMDIETRLADASMDRVAMRNPDNRKHPMNWKAFAATAPALELDTYVANAAVPAVERVNVINPKFYEALNTMIAEVPLEDWKSYFRFRVVSSAASLLPRALEEESWRFHQQYMTGAKEMRPRWKKCVDETDEALGDALGQLYVAENFGVEGKKKMAEIIENLRAALEMNIEALDWMGAETKQRALRKLEAFNTSKVGHPETWKDYSKVAVARDDFFGNSEKAYAFERARNYGLIGGKTDKERWGMTAPTVNAYYSPPLMEIVFPAGILQPPFFNRFGDNAYNYGAIGGVIGHEFSHGFDDSGRKYDHQGNAKDWWTEADAKAFEERAVCMVDQYASYSAGGVNVNGKLTLGENIGDNAGLRIAYLAYKQSLAGEEPPVVDGLSGDQRFFIGWANSWCGNATEEGLRNQIQTDPHSPGQFRAIVPLLNMEEFEKAWGCSAGDAMAPKTRCRVW
ncbi:MAG: M13 family metallopeptidase [Thermoanaerobaculia bacterium]